VALAATEAAGIWSLVSLFSIVAAVFSESTPTGYDGNMARTFRLLLVLSVLGAIALLAIRRRNENKASTEPGLGSFDTWPEVPRKD
jgi:hypothetical protein